MTEFKIELKHLSKMFTQSQIASMLGIKQPNVAARLKKGGDRFAVINTDYVDPSTIEAIKKLCRFYKYEEKVFPLVRVAIISANSVKMEKLK